MGAVMARHNERTKELKHERQAGGHVAFEEGREVMRGEGAAMDMPDEHRPSDVGRKLQVARGRVIMTAFESVDAGEITPRLKQAVACLKSLGEEFASISAGGQGL